MPVVIPPFSQVPAPGDNVKSAWAQQITQYTVDHVNDAVDAHDASAISFVPTGTIAATTVQAAIAELDSEANTRLTKAAQGLVTHVVGVPPTSVSVGEGDKNIGASVTWTADPTRRYKTTVTIPYISNNAGTVATRVEVTLWKQVGVAWEGIGAAGIMVQPGGAGDAVVMMIQIEPPGLTGTQARKLTAAVVTVGGDTITITQPQILIEDIGGV